MNAFDVASRVDIDRLIERLRAHATDATTLLAPRPYLERDIEESLNEVVDVDDAARRVEAVCRSVVDQGRVDGTWASSYRPAADTPLPALFSIIIPTHGRPDLLRAAVQSVCMQHVTSIEVLVIDDASAEPVGDFDDPRVRVIRQPMQRGPAASRNAGLDAARGRYIAFLDDDDLWLPERLDLALAGLRTAPVAICWTKHLGRPEGGHRSLNGFVGDTILDDTTPNLGATAVRRAVAPQFDNGWKAIEDVMWWWELAQTSTVATVPAVGYLVRLHPTRRSWNTVNARVAENLRLLHERPDVVATPRALAHRWLRVGVMATEAGDHRTALVAFLHHLRLRPRASAMAHVLRATARLARLARPRSQTSGDNDRTTSLRVVSLLATDRPRGAERAAAFLADELVNHDVVNRLVSITAGQQAAPRMRVDAVLVDHRVRPTKAWPLLAVRGLRRELRGHPADVILAHGAQAALVAGLAGLDRRGPPIVWQRILALPDWPRWHPNRVRFRFIVRRMHAVVAITAATEHDVRRHGFRGPVWRVPNHRPASIFGAPITADARASVRSELDLAPDALLIGFVGHLVEQKHPEAAIEVIAQVRTTHPDAHLVIAGDGPCRPAVEDAVSDAALDDAVTVLGHRDDIPRILAALDVLVLTSRSESTPGVVIEAQLAGTPVVSYPVDGIDTALDRGRTGIVTASSTPAEAAAAISMLLGDRPRRDAMADATHEREETSTGNVAGRYADLLRTVAGRRDAAATSVLHVLPDLGVGGAEQALSVLASHLTPLGVDQAVCVVSGARVPLAQTVHAELQAAGVPVCDLGVRSRPTRSPLGLVRAAARLRRTVRDLDPEIVDAALLDAVLPSRLALLRKPLVTHLVNTTWNREVLDARGGPRWRDGVLRRIDQWTSRRDDALVALSDTVADAARRDLALEPDDHRVHVVPRGVDTQRFSPGPRPDERACLEVVSVGRLVSQKGHDTLIEATARLRRGGLAVKLRIAGEGPLEADLRAAIASGPRCTVELLGPVRDVPDLLRSASVFALATRWEGQSNAVLEAMAVGMAIVVSDLQVMREVVGEAGVLVPARDIDAWVDALRRLHVDPDERTRLGAAARARALSRYDARARAADLGSLYLKLAGRQPGTLGRRHVPS